MAQEKWAAGAGRLEKSSFGQSSLELLVMFGMAMAFVVAAFTIATGYSQDSIGISQAQDAADRLANGADYVYTLGPNSKEYATIYLPQEIEMMNISGNRVLFKLQTSSGIVDIYATTKGQVINALPQARGKQKVLIQYLPSGKVLIGEAGLYCAPSMITKAFNAGDSDSATITITNNADYDATGISAQLSGSASQVASITQPPQEIGSMANGTMDVDFSVPESQQSGVYAGEVVVNSDNGSCVAQLSVQVNGATSCPSQCNSQGYSDGTCRASQSACIASGEDYWGAFDASCSGGTPRCCCGPTQDALGPIVTYINHTPQNASSSDNITVFATCNDSAAGNSYITNATMQVDGGAFAPMAASSGAFGTAPVQGVQLMIGTQYAGQHIAGVKCTDSANNAGPLAYYYFNVTMGDLIGPIVTYMNHSDAFPTTLANITENGTASDAYVGNNNIIGCYMRLDAGDWIPVNASDGAYDTPTESFGRNFGQMSVGLHTIYSYCMDARNNSGGIFNDTFGVTSADIIVIIDKSGSMAEPITYEADSSQETTTSPSFTKIKSVTVGIKNGDAANTSVQLRGSTTGCGVFYEARKGADVLASGNTTSTSYATFAKPISLAAYSTPIALDLYVKRNISGCTAYVRNFNVTQNPTKMNAAKAAAKVFVDLMDESSKGALVSYSTSASTGLTLMGMGTAENKTTLKNGIDALSPGGNTCIECGLDNGVTEEISSRSRYPEAVRVMVLLTDGQGNVGNTVNGAVYARNNNVTVYTIGLGNDVDSTELTNVALLTYGKYYFAPDAATLMYIYQHIGQ